SFVLIDGINERLAIGRHLGILKDVHDTLRSETLPISRLSKETQPTTAVLVDGSKPGELRDGLAQGAAGIGILRSEWLGWHDRTSPKTETLLSHYQQAARAVAPHRLNIRLFDIGGDKIPKWCEPHSDLLRSPLGIRGIRAASF